MRILTVIAGLIISACGAFCFAFYTNPFTDVAFLVGLVMVLSGICNMIAYLVSGSGKNRTTDTALVEGLVTLLFGFAVLNNQVTDLMLTMFFGTWLTLCGVTRISQSFYVSRFRPKDWAKIIPLGAVATMLGVVMMMPSLVSAVMPLMLVGGAFICDGLSMLMYSMFMKKPTAKSSENEAKARERAEARKALKKAEREERDRQRSLSRQEKEAEQAAQRKEREAAEEERRLAREERKNKKREAARPASEKTMEFTPEEVKQINEAAAEGKAKAEAPSEDTGKTIVNVDEQNPMSAIWATMAKESGADIEIRPVWQRPTDIPTLRSDKEEERKDEDSLPRPIQFAAVKLDEIETEKKAVKFDKVELPVYKLASDDETANRNDVLDEIDKTIIQKEDVDYTPISLEELVAEPLAKQYNPEDAKRFTQTLHFGWMEDEE